MSDEEKIKIKFFAFRKFEKNYLQGSKIITW